MSLVTYASTHGEASGVAYTRFGDEVAFFDAPAKLTMSYTYTAGLGSGNGTFAVPSLEIDVDVPGKFQFGALGGPSTIIVGDHSISFHVSYSVLGGYPPDVVADVSFAGGTLTPGMFPSSLAGLEGVTGTFSVQSQPGINYGGQRGFAIGSAVSAPEPSSALLMGMAMIVALVTGILRSRRLARQR